jgi:hypothetical protein
VKKYVRFELEINGETTTRAAMPSSLGAISSADLVMVSDIPTRLALVNDTDDIVCLATISPAANITITKVLGLAIEDALSEVIYSVAMEEKALAHIIHAESEKIRAAINIPGITIKELLCINSSVESALESIVRLEGILSSKLKSVLKYKREC